MVMSVEEQEAAVNEPTAEGSQPEPGQGSAAGTPSVEELLTQLQQVRAQQAQAQSQALADRVAMAKAQHEARIATLPADQRERERIRFEKAEVALERLKTWEEQRTTVCALIAQKLGADPQPLIDATADVRPGNFDRLMQIAEPLAKAQALERQVAEGQKAPPRKPAIARNEVDGAQGAGSSKTKQEIFREFQQRSKETGKTTIAEYYEALREAGIPY